ncbi:MAG: DUF5666 domain-containing protein [Gammaproteobacteria bacterium]|nr:DUF5666 domain-containing protein [Gammaproteobacteria bacterium]
MFAGRNCNSLRGLLGTLALLLLAGCGIDQGGSQGPPPPGASTSTLVLSGPIASVAGLTVNDTALDTASAPVVVGGGPAVAADLRVGQMIRAIAELESGMITALFIEYQENLSGDVESIDAGTDSLVVLGQTILTDSATQFDLPGVTRLVDLQAGTRVQVSGIPLANGQIFATYIGADNGIEPFELTAILTAVDQPGLTFDIGALTVDFSQAMLLDVVAGMPQVGSIVRVVGSNLAGNVLVAEQVRAVRRLPGAFNADATQISDNELGVVGAAPANADRSASFVGFITVENLPDSVFIGDVEIQLDAATIVVAGVPADLQPGTRIQVEGRILGVGIVQAEEITIL